MADITRANAGLANQKTLNRNIHAKSHRAADFNLLMPYRRQLLQLMIGFSLPSRVAYSWQKLLEYVAELFGGIVVGPESETVAPPGIET